MTNGNSLTMARRAFLGAAGTLEQGGMIEIKLVDGRTRFDINLLAARAAGLTLSSQLLQLAERVVK